MIDPERKSGAVAFRKPSGAWLQVEGIQRELMGAGLWKEEASPEAGSAAAEAAVSGLRDAALQHGATCARLAGPDMDLLLDLNLERWG